MPNIPLLSQVAQYGCLVAGTAGAAIIDAVAPHRDDVVLTHHRVSCFHGTELDVVLRGAGIDTVILAGVVTNLAVESTARASADLGYRTLVVSDACSTTSETAHNASLASIAMLGGAVTMDDVLATLERQHAETTATHRSIGMPTVEQSIAQGRRLGWRSAGTGSTRRP